MKKTIKSQVEEMKQYVLENNLTSITDLKYSRATKSYEMKFNGLPLAYSNIDFAWDMLRVANK
jgi:hypothetical protein